MPETLLISSWKQATFHCSLNFSTAGDFTFRGIKLQTLFPYFAVVSQLLLSGARSSEQRAPQLSSHCLGLGNYSCLPLLPLQQQELSVKAAVAGCDKQSGPRIALGPDRA